MRCTREYLSRFFLVFRAPQNDRLSEVKCLGEPLRKSVRAVCLKCNLIKSNNSKPLNVDDWELTISKSKSDTNFTEFNG